MGLYVNPIDQSKEDWAARHARSHSIDGSTVTGSNHAEIIASGRVPLVLVDNGPFRALAVLYSPREAEDFARDDGRRKIFLTVDRAALESDASGVGQHMLEAYNI